MFINNNNQINTELFLRPVKFDRIQRGGMENSKISSNAEKEEPRRETGVLTTLWSMRRLILILLTPVLLLPLPLTIKTTEAGCAYVLVLMAVYWMTEVLPLGVTALLPIILFPIFGIRKSRDVTPNYMKENIMLALGAYMIAIALERWNLHRRIALRVLLLVGTSAKWLMFGFMSTSAFLSMWVSNTSTTAMMAPIVEAVIQQMRVKHTRTGNDKEMQMIKNELNHQPTAKKKMSMDHHEGNNEHTVNVIRCEKDHRRSSGSGSDPLINDNQSADEASFKDMCKAMSLCIAYAANFGGSATMIGTGAVILMVTQTEIVLSEHGYDDVTITFTNWMLFSLPTSLVCLALTWLWLQLYFFRKQCSCFNKENPETGKAIKTVLHAEYDKLGPMSFAEKVTCVHFACLALLWLTRSPGFVAGWADLFPHKYVGGSVPAIFIAFCLFVFPASKQDFFQRVKGRSCNTVLEWKYVARNIPWNVFFLFGGGMALADGCKVSGLSRWLGSQLEVMHALPPWVVVLVTCIMASFLTEFTSNVAVVSIVMPILGEMSVAMDMNPLYLMIPGGVACCFAFMLPVATPPNAIVFSYGHLKVIDMMKAGFVVNLIGILAITLSTNTWGMLIYDFTAVRAAAVNVTSIHNMTTHTPL